MKTSHQFARELLAGPDLPIFHFDPSCAGYKQDDDTSVASPRIEKVEQFDEYGKPCEPVLTIVGNQHEEYGLDSDT